MITLLPDPLLTKILRLEADVGKAIEVGQLSAGGGAMVKPEIGSLDPSGRSPDAPLLACPGPNAVDVGQGRIHL